MLAHPSVAVLDDHHVVRQGYVDLFLSGGFDVPIACATGEQLLDHFQKQGPTDLAVVDLHLVGMDGFTVLKRINGGYPSVRTVALSFSVAQVHMEQAALCGARGYLSKDMDGSESLAVLQNVHRYGIARVSAGAPDGPPAACSVELPPREREYLDVLATVPDPSDKVVAEHMGLSTARVGALYRYFRDRFGVRSRLDLLLRLLHWRTRR